MENSSGRWGWMGSRAILCHARSGGAFKPRLVNLSPGVEISSAPYENVILINRLTYETVLKAFR